jgi:hypothetical protein
MPFKNSISGRFRSLQGFPSLCVLTQVTQMPYPLKIKPQGKYKYFQQREEWKVTDILMNPMVMMMLLPLLLVTVLPKMMQVLFRPSTYCLPTWVADPVELGRDPDPDPVVTGSGA